MQTFIFYNFRDDLENTLIENFPKYPDRVQGI